MSQFTGVMGLSSSEVAALIARNEPDGVAGLYACKTILNEHRPVCTYHADLYGKYLDVTDNPDVWYPLADTGTITYANRKLTLATTASTAGAVRAVINTTAYAITSNFLEASCKLAGASNGTGGVRNSAFGFGSAFSAYPATERAIFARESDNKTYICYRGGKVSIATLPLGRELTAGDILTVRLDRKEGSANIDIARFYVNGQKQYETENIPQANCYAGIGVYADADATTVRSVQIDYFSFRFVP